MCLRFTHCSDTICRGIQERRHTSRYAGHSVLRSHTPDTTPDIQHPSDPLHTLMQKYIIQHYDQRSIWLEMCCSGSMWPATLFLLSTEGHELILWVCIQHFQYDCNAVMSVKLINKILFIIFSFCDLFLITVNYFKGRLNNVYLLLIFGFYLLFLFVWICFNSIESKYFFNVIFICFIFYFKSLFCLYFIFRLHVLKLFTLYFINVFQI